MRICKINCISNQDNEDLDRIVGGPVSDELVAMTKSSPQQPGCSQNLLGVVPAPTNDAGSSAELPPREGRTEELREGGPCHGPRLVYLSLMCYLGHTCALLNRHVKNSGILFTPAKICTREN